MAGKRKHRRRQNAQSQSGSDSSVLKSSTDSETACSSKKQKFVTSTPVVQGTLSRFAYEPRSEDNNMADVEPIDLDNSKGAISPSISEKQDRVVSNAELMDKLCENGKEISRLTRVVEELRAALLTVQIENDEMKKEMSEARKREQLLQNQLTETRHLAELADKKTEDLSAYIRRNNLRVYGLEEDDAAETAQQCEAKIIKLINNKLKVPVKREDIEAVHRVGARPTQATGQRQGVSSGHAKNNPRGVIVRFVSRRIRDSVLYARKSLKGTRVVLVEDLTPRAYQLLCAVKADKTVCQQAWTKNGSVVMKTLNGRIVTVKSLADFRQADQRALWSQHRH